MSFQIFEHPCLERDLPLGVPFPMFAVRPLKSISPLYVILMFIFIILILFAFLVILVAYRIMGAVNLEFKLLKGLQTKLYF